MQVDKDGNYQNDGSDAYSADPKTVVKVDEETLRRQVWEAMSELTEAEVEIVWGAGVTREALIDMIVYAISHADDA